MLTFFSNILKFISHLFQIYFNLIPNREKWYYLAGKNLFALLRGITWKNYSNFYSLNYLHSFRMKNKHESHKKVCGNKDYLNVVTSSKSTKILEFKVLEYLRTCKIVYLIKGSRVTFGILDWYFKVSKNNKNNSKLIYQISKILTRNRVILGLQKSLSRAPTWPNYFFTEFFHCDIKEYYKI